MTLTPAALTQFDMSRLRDAAWAMLQGKHRDGSSHPENLAWLSNTEIMDDYVSAFSNGVGSPRTIGRLRAEFSLPRKVGSEAIIHAFEALGMARPVTQKELRAHYLQLFNDNEALAVEATQAAEACKLLGLTPPLTEENIRASYEKVETAEAWAAKQHDLAHDPLFEEWKGRIAVQHRAAERARDTLLALHSGLSEQQLQHASAYYFLSQPARAIKRGMAGVDVSPLVLHNESVLAASTEHSSPLLADGLEYYSNVNQTITASDVQRALNKLGFDSKTPVTPAAIQDRKWQAYDQARTRHVITRPIECAELARIDPEFATIHDAEQLLAYPIDKASCSEAYFAWAATQSGELDGAHFLGERLIKQVHPTSDIQAKIKAALQELTLDPNKPVTTGEIKAAIDKLSRVPSSTEADAAFDKAKQAENFLLGHGYVDDCRMLDGSVTLADVVTERTTIATANLRNDIAELLQHQGGWRHNVGAMAAPYWRSRSMREALREPAVAFPTSHLSKTSRSTLEQTLRTALKDQELTIQFVTNDSGIESLEISGRGIAEIASKYPNPLTDYAARFIEALPKLIEGQSIEQAFTSTAQSIMTTVSTTTHSPSYSSSGTSVSDTASKAAKEGEKGGKMGMVALGVGAAVVAGWAILERMKQKDRERSTESAQAKG